MANLRNSRRKIRVISAPAALPAAFLALTLAGPAALAANGPEPQRIPMPQPGYETLTVAATHAERCRLYERRFDDAVKSHGDAAGLDEAQTLRIEGGKLCGTGDATLGIHKLREALNRIGVDSTL
jgi:hypothetical protein